MDISLTAFPSAPENAAQDLPKCHFCRKPVNDDHPVQAVDHAVAAVASHYFNSDCMQEWVKHRHAQNLPITCPLDGIAITGIGGIPFAPPVPQELLPPDDLPDEDPFSPLFFAAWNNKLSVVKALLATGSGNISEAKYSCAVQVAASQGNYAILQILLVHNANISDRGHISAIKRASGSGHLKAVEVLLAYRHISDDTRGEAVILASQYGRLSVVRKLLANNVNISDPHHILAIESASMNGHLKAVEVLLAYRHISDDARGKAVILASQYGCLSVVRKLLANRDISEHDRNRAIIEATNRNHQGVVRFLRNEEHSWISIVTTASVAIGAITWVANRIFQLKNPIF